MCLEVRESGIDQADIPVPGAVSVEGWTSPGLSRYIPPLSSYLLTGGAVSSSGDTEVGRRERGTQG